MSVRVWCTSVDSLGSNHRVGAFGRLPLTRRHSAERERQRRVRARLVDDRIFLWLIFVFGFKITELMLLSTLLAAFLCTAGAFAPGNGPRDQTNRGTLPLSATALPQMEPRWQMNQSTIIMPCNNSGYMDPARTVGWSIIDFDWSNGKAIWTKQRPVREQRPLTLCGRRVLQ